MPERSALTAAAEPAEQIAEQIGEVEAGGLEIEAGEWVEARAERLVPAPVVGRALVGIGQNREGLGDLLELLLGGLVALVDVGVVLARQAAVGRLDLLLAGASGQTQDLVVVLLRHLEHTAPYPC